LIPSEYSAELKALISSMLIRDPVLRPDVDNLLKNIFKSYRANSKSPRKCKYLNKTI
jgi:hypothetical protein